MEAAGLLGVPVERKDDWNSPVAAHFSTAQWFALVAGSDIVSWTSAGSLPCRERVELLQRAGVVVVVAPAVSAEGLSALSEAGISALKTVAGDLREAVLSLMTGTVEALEDASCCGRHLHGEEGCLST
jgi:predicted Fe-Mo cluster-binding NifX family protein